MIIHASANPPANAPGRSGKVNAHAHPRADLSHEVAFGYPRDFLWNKFVYLVISPRAHGLSIGVNLNPVATCNMNCLYCEVDRTRPAQWAHLDINRMAKELEETLELTQGEWLRQWPRYSKLPEELLKVRHVTLSGDGEPTLSSQFIEATRAVVHLRQLCRYFKIILVTNSTALDRPAVQEGLSLLAWQDEVWAKLDGGTQDYLRKVNGPAVSLEKILDNILQVARRRPVVIQSLFPAINGEEPSAAEIKEYAQRLKELRAAGAEISLVQIYSATRPTVRPGCTHLPLKALSRIAQTVRRVSGLRAEIF